MIDDRIQLRFKIITLATVIINLFNFIFLLSLSMYGQTNQASGLEFIAIAYLPVVFLGYALAIFYVFYYPYYVFKYKTSDGYVALGTGVVIIILSVVALQFYFSKKQDEEKAIANKILTVQEAQPLVDSCNIKAIDEGSKRVQGLRGDVTYITLKNPIDGQGGSRERYVEFEDFDEMVSSIKQKSFKCGDANIYTREDLRASRYP